MSEREGSNWPIEGKPVAADVSERLRSILADAESAADAIRHQAESDAQARRRAAETESLKIIEDARREAERFLADRIHRVSELSDEILERGQSVVERLDEAEQVRSELAGLVRSLGETAARLANEVRAMPGPQTPELAASAAPAAPARAVRPEPEPVRDPEPEPEPVRDPEPEPEPMVEEPVAEAPLVEPTPLRRDRIEPNAIELSPAPEPVEERGGPTPEEIELLERVRAAERERAEAETVDQLDDAPVSAAGPDPEPPFEAPEAEAEHEQVAHGDQAPSSNGDGAGHIGDGDRPGLVEVTATPDAPEAGAPAAGAGPDQTLGARLVALQMAVAGGNRGEVESHLRRAFDLDEPGQILDDIFGTGTDADKRVVWPEAG